MADQPQLAPKAPAADPGREPDVAKLVAMVAGAALSTMTTLAAVATLSVGWVLLACLVPVVCWGLLLREIHVLLRYRGEEPEIDAERDAKVWKPRV